MKQGFGFIIFLCLIIQNYFGQIVDPFSIRYQVNQKGGLVFLANTSVGCNCTANSEMPPGGTSDNNSFSMSFVDVDSDASTYMSSTDQLALPNCSEILWAGLYWEGILNDIPANTANFTNRNKVKLSVNNSSYTTLTADELLDNTTGKITYFAFKDITSIVQANPISASYRVADVVTETGTNTFGGWTMVVVYRNIYETMKNLTVFDGLVNVSIGASADIDINGFLTPPSGAVNFELGVVAHDGDRGQDGDQLQFNGTGTFVEISDALHPADNAFNSTISKNGVLTPLRIPSYNNNLGHDANIYSPDNSAFTYIGNSATSASIRVSTVSETVLSSVITSAIDIYEPDLRASVSYTDLNAGTVRPGDILEYSITAKNIGSDVSIDTYLSDTLDERLTYIPGTLQVSFGPNSGIKTDATDADQAEFILADNVIKARIGTGADGANGGAVNNSSSGADSTVIKFRVRLTNDCAVWQCGSVLRNKAYLFGTGQISGITNGNDGASDLLDAFGCPSPESGLVNVDVSACPDTVITFTDSLCVGETISLSYPNSTFLDISWTGPNNFTSNINNPTISNAQTIHSGDYVLHVSYNGDACIDDTIAPIFVGANPTIQLIETQNDTCFQAGSGFLRVAASGNGPFTYSWSNNDADSLAQNLLAGNYTVTVEDELGCSASSTFPITEPPLMSVTASITSNYNGAHISCFNATDGSGTAVGAGGVQPYSFEWSPSNQLTENLTNVGAGIHIVTMTDDSGCQAKDTITLVQPNELIITGIVTDILCFGDNNGVINATITGGTLPYTFEWSNNAVTEDLTNVVAGIYTDTVTDINGCEATNTFTINQPTSSMTLSATFTEILCPGTASSNINLTVSGGVFPYDFSWSSGEDTEDLTGKTAGTYSVDVTDDNNCVQSLSVTVNEPPQMTLNVITTNPVCQSDSQGSLDLTVGGGTPSYTFSWNTGEETEDIAGLYAGNYRCIVTDDNGCSDTLLTVLTDPDALVINETHVDVLCYGASTGSIDITPSNGTDPYSFDWSNDAFSEDINNLSAGLYSVNVTDFNGCGGFMSFDIDQPDTLIHIISSTVTDVLCFGDTNGAINIEVVGGTGSYDYDWSNNDATQDILNLSSGSYTVDITDDNGCQLSFTENVQGPNELSLSETHIDVLCFGTSTGSIDITTLGGTFPYDFLWNPSSINEDLINIPIGTYFLTATDDNGCQDTLTVVIDQPSAALSISSVMNPVLCFDGNDGSIDITVSGGTTAYTFDWDNAPDNEDIANLSGGTYTVTVTDANLCEETQTISVTQPASAVSLVATGNSICFGATNGEAFVIATGGTEGYTYLWSTSPNDTLESVQNLAVGTYSVIVTDANACSETISVTIAQPDGLEGCVALEMPNIFTPDNDLVNDSYIPFKAFNISEYHVIILNRWGESVYEGNEFVQGWDGKINGKEASEGVYFWKVDYVDSYGAKGELQGNVTLVRD